MIEDQEFYECKHCGSEIPADEDHVTEGPDHYCDDDCYEAQLGEELEAEAEEGS